MRITIFLLAVGLMTGQSNAQSSEAPIPGLEFAFEALVTLGTGMASGKTPYGNRNIIPITGGTFEGPDIKGTIIPGAGIGSLFERTAAST